MTQHTPGPWKAEKAIRHGWTVGNDVFDVIPTGDDEGRYGMIADEADARLIAAAPDMLAALQKIAAFHVGDQPTESPLSEVDWVKKHVGELRFIARAAAEKACAVTSDHR